MLSTQTKFPKDILISQKDKNCNKKIKIAETWYWKKLLLANNQNSSKNNNIYKLKNYHKSKIFPAVPEKKFQKVNNLNEVFLSNSKN